MVVYLCVFIVFSLHQESLKLILVDKPLPEVVLSQLVIRASLRQHTSSQKFTATLSRWGTLSPYQDYSSLLRWQPNIFVHMHLWNCINEGMSWFFRVFSLFCCWWPYFVVCGFCRTIKDLWVSSFLFMRLFGCLCLAVGQWVKYPWWGWCEMPMMGMIDPSSAGILTLLER
jgi:hypothetical protein